MSSARTPLKPLALAALCALTLCSCGDTLQNKPLGATALEQVIVKSRFPVYWLGAVFDGLHISSVTIDPSEAVTIKYGNCLVGGQYTCVASVTIVTSPDNGFVPGGATRSNAIYVRGVRALASQDARTVSIPTGPVVVSVYARAPALAAAAASMMAPLNKLGLPLAPLPAVVPNTGVEDIPLPGQVPPGAEIPSAPTR